MSKRFRDIVRNYAATMAFLLSGWFFYSYSPHFAEYFSGRNAFGISGWTIVTRDAFFWIVIAYAAVLLPYYYFETEESSASKFLRGIFRKRFDEEWKKSARTLALKGFFAPLMVGWLISHAGETVTGFERIFLTGEFEWAALETVPFFVFAFQAVLFADVFFFTAGYLMEGGIWKNRIVSVDPTVSGWVVCLLCYPPFNGGTEDFIGWYSSDHPMLPNSPELTTVLNFLIIGLMAVYAWASVALGWKASNLTNRGIVSK
ncbi:MAG: hypothetical protein QG650_1039 [Patescibacteria group bacterium]|nr:hypothetical protein [Patescibacteria group bacterium]